MDEIRIRAATAADVPAIVGMVDRAYRHYIARIGKPPGRILDDYAARVSTGTARVCAQCRATDGHHWPNQRLRTAHPSQPPYSGPITVTMQSASAYSLLPPLLLPPMPANNAETIDTIAVRGFQVSA